MQLKFDDDFSSITDVNFYNSLEDLPLEIHDFIINTTDNFYFYNEINKKIKFDYPYQIHYRHLFCN